MAQVFLKNTEKDLLEQQLSQVSNKHSLVVMFENYQFGEF